MTAIQQRTTANGSNGHLNNGTGGHFVVNEPRPRYDGGWRAGKPAEDPEKLKMWGRISARPSEYLIHMRRGKVPPAGSRSPTA